MQNEELVIPNHIKKHLEGAHICKSRVFFSIL